MLRSIIAGIALAALCPLPVQAQSVDFNRDIRPILADACFHCHGPDQARRKADLRLDQEETARKVIAAGKLVQRILSSDPMERMPPLDSGRKLSVEQVDLLNRWVRQGAPWRKHWAFIAPARPELPAVRDASWIENPIDRFVLARLEKEGLKPSTRADLTTLIRRASFDLTGLPPTPAEIEAFIQEFDKNPRAAYAKVVDRLLASPRYGERMAWRWLEAARYADTHGYQTDGPRDMYRWRDWVIDAYNRNLPFDQFTVEQLAGDLLPNATLDQRIATGFNRNHRGNSEGGIVPEEYAVEYVVDRVETTSTVWLGLTMGCARCHEHKYDPFSQKEFYQLYAFFNSIPEKGRAEKYGNSPPYVKAPTKDDERKGKNLYLKWRAAEDANEKHILNLDQAREQWENNVKPAELADWAPTRGLTAHVDFAKPQRFQVESGRAVFQPGIAGTAIDLDCKRFADCGNLGDFGFDDKFTISFWVKPRSLNGALISRMAEEPRADGYSIQLVDGKIQVHLTKRWLDDALRVESEASLELNRWHHIVVSYDGSHYASGVRIAIDDSKWGVRVLLDELNQSFQNNAPLRIGSGGGPSSRFDGQIAEVLIYNRLLQPGEIHYLACADSLAQIVAIPEARRNPRQIQKIEHYFLHNAAPREMRDADAKVTETREALYRFKESIPTVMVMEELPKPNDAFVLIRGEYDKRGEKVNRAVPASLSAFPDNAPLNRLGLAKWLVDPANPLTARVAVNRIWQLHFGTGLVKTVEDFGTQGEYPSHPELLDWLATEFIRTGWDVKKMHKLIVTSATYQQSSQMRNENQKDPENRLLWRGPRYRLSAEMVRDQALFACGLLVEKVGGPSVKPYQPAGLWKELSGTDDYVQDHGDSLYRRSLYTFWKRTSAPPSLMTFDASARETCWVRETRTNTPLQALTLLNDVTYVEAARVLAERIIKEKKSPEDRIDRAFMLLISRKPTAAERSILSQALKQHLEDYNRNPAAAKKLLNIGEKKADAAIDARELAAYAQICSLILNLDESVTKE